MKLHGIIIGIIVIVLAVFLLGNFERSNPDTETSLEAQVVESLELTQKESLTINTDDQLDSMQNVTTISMTTSMGDITFELWPDLAPKTVENFITLAKDGFYDGTRFHRVIPGFMIQAGDPNSNDVTKKDLWGRGGPGYQFEDEIHGQNKNAIGTISMANAGPSTNGSQFFINVADNNFLDDKHTVFGRVVQGMDIVTAISIAPTEGPDRPVDDILINSISIAQ